MTEYRVDLARRLVRAFLGVKDAPTPAEIYSAVAQAVAIASTATGVDGTVDEAVVRREFEANYSVFYASGTQVLDDKTGHVPWLPEARASINWNFWGRYEHFQTEVKHIPGQVVARLGSTTDDILSRLEAPSRPGTWDRRGLVVGNVQSGKTSNYSGLICKALDSGYKVVVVLAGLHKSLRSQTQMRIDQGIIGFDTSKNPIFSEDNRWIGVGTLPSWPRLRVNSLTTSKNNGDFSRAVSSQMTTALGGDPYILVVKKHKSILDNLIKWALHTNGIAGEGGKKTVRDVPLLVIDDEADNASVNTKRVPKGEDPSDYDPSAINEKIRELLAAFEKRAYVGYTATPFANIFVPVDIAHERLEDDIFPRSFILSLAEPSNYVGPARVFGLDGDPDAGIEAQDGLPIVETIDDHVAFFPDKYKKDHDPGGLPDSLKQAIRVFILASAARRARGETAVHNSMLIHVARFVAVQGKVFEYVEEEVGNLQRRIRFARSGSGDRVLDELKDVWTSELVPCSRKLASLGYEEVPWTLVEAELREAAERTTVRLINGEATDILDYHEHPGGINVIAIGGDKLSRGLTLEGLSVSYYLRAARMYDTLMQMGRWFGYRDGYLDLCKLYTTQELVDWYRHIALADIELRRDFQTMVDCGMTPTDFGLRVRTHPDGLLITALNKSRYTTAMQLSFAGRLAQSKFLLTSDKSREHNCSVARKFIETISSESERPDPAKRFWRGVKAARVVDFLRKVDVPAKDVDMNGERLADFIGKQLANGGLTTWSVLVASAPRMPTGRDDFVPLFPGLAPVTRTPADAGELPMVMALKKANILDPPHQYADFDGVTLSQAHLDEIRDRRIFQDGRGGEDLAILERSIGRNLIEIATEISVARHDRGEGRKNAARPTAPNGRVVRDVRRRSEGLLIIYPAIAGTGDKGKEPMIGMAISFPTDESAAPVEYRVNQVYEQIHLSDLDEADDNS